MTTFIRMGKCPGRNDCEAAVKDPRLIVEKHKVLRKNINDAQRRKNKKD